MLWVVKLSRWGDQTKITLPKGFVEKHELMKLEYVALDDRDCKNITFRRILDGSEESKADTKD